MSDFTAEQVLGYYDVATRLPEVTDEQARAAVLNALQEEVSKGWNEVSIRFGAVWDRKGYPDTGHISDKVSSSSYRRIRLDTSITPNRAAAAIKVTSPAEVLDRNPRRLSLYFLMNISLVLVLIVTLHLPLWSVNSPAS